MPVKRFWFYNKMVDRLSAEEDLRMINLLASAASGEAYGQRVEILQKQLGEIVVMMPTKTSMVIGDNGEELDPEFDRAGLAALKDMLRRQRR